MRERLVLGQRTVVDHRLDSRHGLANTPIVTSEALSSHSARATSRSTPYLLAPPYLLMPKGKPRHR
ncbi:hypothetical protein ABT126_08810 [Streptomyces sp. NPDC002012]|uniref:hypothetical protein n=1 Tax=Streptomyces sp. NPDC002012 TaxID=3154532 RepID=UPI00332041D0